MGLGLGGAFAINLCGGLVLTAWLIFGQLDIPTGGRIFMWILAATLVVVSTIELLAYVKGKRQS